MATWAVGRKPTKPQRAVKLALKFLKPCQPNRSRGFLLSAPMKFPEPLESRMYGDPMEILSAKQAQAANQARRQAQQPVKRPTLTAKPRADGEWSEARRRAEALFES